MAGTQAAVSKFVGYLSSEGFMVPNSSGGYITIVSILENFLSQEMSNLRKNRKMFQFVFPSTTTPKTKR